MWISSEIKKRIKEVEDQLAIEKDVLGSIRQYRDCELKTLVLYQCQGVIRGLEVALAHLDQLEQMAAETDDQISFNDEIDFRGGLIRGAE